MSEGGIVDKLIWATRLVRSRTYMVLTDKGAVVSMPIIDPGTFKSSLILVSQMTALNEFKDRLEDLIEEHEQALKLLYIQETREAERKPNSKAGGKVSPASKKAK